MAAADVEPEGTDRDYVASLARGLSVIRAFSRSRPSMTLSEVAQRADMNRAAARRFLLTLVREGYAETDGKYFRLRPKILELGFSALSSLSFAEIAEPPMEDLSAELGETCLAAVLDGDLCVYIARASASRVVSVDLDVGSTLPAFTMSTGRVLLAAMSDDELDRWLDEFRPVRYTDHTVMSRAKLRDDVVAVREKGWSIVDQEYEIGFRSLSVPIRDQGDAVVAALNVCCPSPRVSLEKMQEEFLPATQATAAEIQRSLPEAYRRRARDLRVSSR
ncbi:IclR family transcriptional regulator C-terminal domain-containing protein [Conexibacter sp. JD483]|uniref:IclR family transcriptional regulator domain-containing protein n=1 Tax=unclassified Conexibacter TaxID=2627773 RepID=UPI0027208AB9|nr:MULTISPECIES: IclR family transcriptional regulator C-terminal domain-containing protein [unclassified Conexibacter]MDO8185271.1 IclR family transcriptional regulator C-terminal domain-containing protein [Conexibacter sp. CPCC 205706]MDO8198317.1 IclR family transcriptional regulator C-terminal domain-containing protein [Conexibacter sp. CPCC 205762]MDR9367722.1 IclR family transcriptional regulator C-terminal domain-containing protein [Conexibacter sp. JD483]